MAQISNNLKEKLLTIIQSDYEDCQFFVAASQLLVNKIKDLSKTIEQRKIDFEELRDNIGELGIFISNTEKRLEEVEECYTQLVETLSDEK